MFSLVAIAVAAVSGSVVAYAIYTNKVQRQPITLPVSSSDLLGSRGDFLGDPSSPYTLVEIMDYQCPPCKQTHKKLPDLLARYKGKLRLTVRNFPLAFHKNAVPAAIAAEAAREQGKFWPMHNALMESNQLDAAHIDKIVREQHLDIQRYTSAVASTAKATVKFDQDQANTLAINSTPTFLLCDPQGQVYQLFTLDQIAPLLR